MVRLIDANALFNDLKASAKSARKWREETQDEEIKIRAEQAHGTFVECALRVKNAPTIDAEPVRHGKWIVREAEFGVGKMYECSVCHEMCEHYTHIHYNPSPYCMHCGARMDGGKK